MDSTITVTSSSSPSLSAHQQRGEAAEEVLRGYVHVGELAGFDDCEVEVTVQIYSTGKLVWITTGEVQEAAKNELIECFQLLENELGDTTYFGDLGFGSCIFFSLLLLLFFVFLDGVLGVLGVLAVGRQSFLHDATDAGDWQISALLLDAPAATYSSFIFEGFAPRRYRGSRQPDSSVLPPCSRNASPESSENPGIRLGPGKWAADGPAWISPSSRPMLKVQDWWMKAWKRKNERVMNE
ncbi:hypothetical protein EV1_020259 [Malus domestica]